MILILTNKSDAVDLILMRKEYVNNDKEKMRDMKFVRNENITMITTEICNVFKNCLLVYFAITSL